MQVPITRSVVLLATLSLLLPQGSATRLVAENRNVRSEGILERQATPKGISQSTAPTGASGDFAGLIDIGGGRKMYLECRGSDSPTVILESGYRNDGDIWSAALEPGMNTVFAEVARFTRVCAYDRRERFSIRIIWVGARPSPCRARHAISSPIFMHCSRRRTSPDRTCSLRIPLAASLPAYTQAHTRRRLLEWSWLMRCPKR